MVLKHTTYRCGKCRSWFNTYREAEHCEILHTEHSAIKEAVDEIGAAFSRELDTLYATAAHLAGEPAKGDEA